ncbi:MAG: PIG-L family deacetylase [Candidatus Roizmanbacteria bacterium]|nr:PIG-L family deacetylase [Candidatus Roizmanbacteria bacterium]
MKEKKVLLVFSHPDDESFGPGGTIALWAKQGHEIHLISATKGEIGNNHTDDETARVREAELNEASRILGVKKISYLGYKDGHICNKHIPILELRITEKIINFKPDLVMTFNLLGLTGHLDHVAIANATTSAFDKTGIAEKLYYYSLPKAYTDTIENYFIHFPDGAEELEFDEVIDTSEVWDTKIAAMMAHKSQQEDIDRIIAGYEKFPQKKDHYFIRQRKTT